MNDKLLKGGVLLGYFNFIRHQWGDDGVDECIKVTGVNPRQLKEEAYYPWEMNKAILEWISGSKGMECMNRFLQKAKANYEDTFKYGEVSVLNDGFGKRATVIMKNCNVIEESGNAWLGAFEGMMELTRSKGTVKHIKRQVDGADYDEFLLDWE